MTIKALDSAVDLPEILSNDDIAEFTNAVNDALAKGLIMPSHANAFIKAGTLALQSFKLKSEQGDIDELRSMMEEIERLRGEAAQKAEAERKNQVQ